MLQKSTITTLPIHIVCRGSSQVINKNEKNVCIKLKLKEHKLFSLNKYTRINKILLKPYPFQFSCYIEFFYISMSMNVNINLLLYSYIFVIAYIIYCNLY